MSDFPSYLHLLPLPQTHPSVAIYIDIFPIDSVEIRCTQNTFSTKIAEFRRTCRCLGSSSGATNCLRRSYSHALLFFFNINSSFLNLLNLNRYLTYRPSDLDLIKRPLSLSAYRCTVMSSRIT